MVSGTFSQMMDRRRLEALLAETLIPVEPRMGFIRRLKAAQVNYEGGGAVSAWQLIVVLATGLVMLATSLGLVLRLVLAVLSLVGLVMRQKPAAPAAGSVRAGERR
jgi:hypothetical protein